MVHYILASKPTPYAAELFKRLCKSSQSKDPKPFWNLVESPDDLEDLLKKFDPDQIGYIFFFHWGWIVPKKTHELYPCVVIHTSNLPEGRGGSPLQNQIVDGIWQSRVNALKMIDKLDAGSIFHSEEISLQGTMHDIWWTIMLATEKIIQKMVENYPFQPITPQDRPDGVPYKRRKKEHNRLPVDSDNIIDLYDHIRMLDGNNYPKSYLEIGKFRFEFDRASLDLEKREIKSDVKISLLSSQDS